MANYVTKIHDGEDGRLYGILSNGSFPTVVFKKVIGENAVPGTQYYFSDGLVKYFNDNADGGYAYWPYRPGQEDSGDLDPEARERTSGGVIFTIPENFDFSRMGEHEYMMGHTTRAKGANLNTTSPNYIIRNGQIICIKTLKIEIMNSLGESIMNIFGDNIQSKSSGYVCRSFKNCGNREKGRGGRRIRNQRRFTTCGNNHKIIIPFGSKSKRIKSVYQYHIVKKRRRTADDADRAKKWKLYLL